MPEITPRKLIKADPTLRMVTVAALVAMSLLGGVAIAYTKSFTERLRMIAAESPERAASMAADAFKTTTALGAVIPLLVGAYLTLVSVRALRSHQFPPPGTRVLRDTVVTVGPKSRTWAKMGFLIAILLVAGGILILVWGWRLADSLVQSSTLPAVN